jgi:hypothetical protein
MFQLIWMIVIGGIGFAAVCYSERKTGSGGLRAAFADWRDGMFGRDPIGATEDWADIMSGLERYEGPQDGFKKAPQMAVERRAQLALPAGPVRDDRPATSTTKGALPVRLIITTQEQLDDLRWEREFRDLDDRLELAARRNDQAVFAIPGVEEEYRAIQRRQNLVEEAGLHTDEISVGAMFREIERHLIAAENVLARV